MSELLKIAGLSPEEASTYLAVLGLPAFTVAQARQACTGVGGAALSGILGALAGKGLLSQISSQPCRYAPIPPQAVLEPPLAERAGQLRNTRAAVASLAERYRAVPRCTAADELAEIVTGKRRTWQRWSAAMAGASSQVRVLNRPPFEAESPAPFPAELRALGKGIPVRVVYDESGVRSPAVIARRRAEIAAGEQARITAALPVHLMLVDSDLAVLPLARDRLRTDGLLMVRPCALLDALAALFELVWASALPLSLDPPSQAGGHPAVLCNPTTHSVLGLLSAGLSDQAIARRLGCSERTIQRHVMRLTEATGAKTRFQTALHLGRRGWT